MQGYVLIADEAYPLLIHPGFRFADGRALSLEEAGDSAVLVIGDTRLPIVYARDGDRLWVHLAGRAHEILWRDAVDHHAEAAVKGAGGVERAPMPGSVVSIAVAAGDSVKAGDMLLVIESMKLETTIRAAIDGVVEQIHVTLGQTFERDVPLATVVQEG